MAGSDLGSNPVEARRSRRVMWSGRIARALSAVPFLSVHLGCLAAFLTGVDRPALLLCAGTYLVRMFGITAGYHRYFSHRSYRTSRPVQFILAVLGCSAMQKGPLWWVAHHRDHHRHSDTPRDPHSPVLDTLWWAHVGWIFAAGRSAVDRNPVRDLRGFQELGWLDRHHWVPGLALAAACYLSAGPTGLVWGFFVSTVLCYHATFAINSLGHRLGSRRYSTADESRNNLALALITLGEGWHNNHHYCAGSANQGFFWWEIDITYYLIKFLERAGLVWDVRNPPPAKLLARSRRDRDPRPRDALFSQYRERDVAEPRGCACGRSIEFPAPLGIAERGKRTC